MPRQDRDALEDALTRTLGTVPRPAQLYAGHFVLGTGLGVAYSLLVEALGSGSVPRAMAFAGTEELLGNELLGWRIRLVRAPGNYSPSERIHSFLSHLVWAAVAEPVRRCVRGRM